MTKEKKIINEKEKKQRKKANIETPLALSSSSGDICEIQEQVLVKYGGDWAQFFLDWRSEQEKWQAKASQELASSKEQYSSLYAQYLAIEKQLEEVHQESMRQKEKDSLKEARKMKRQRSKKLPLRATVSIDEFWAIIELVAGRCPLIIARRRLAFALLYLTGLRVSNILIFSVSNVKELLLNGKTVISLIKGGESRNNLILTNQGRALLKNFNRDYEKLVGSEKKGSDYIFSSPKNNEKHLDSDNFDRELNYILTKASTIFEKHLRTHSFRATFITDLLKSVEIDEVKEIVGHRSIATTLEYKRSRLSISETKELLEQRDPLITITKVTKKTKKTKKKDMVNE